MHPSGCFFKCINLKTKVGGDYVKYEDAYQDYCAGMKYKDIAEKYHVSVSAIKSWATRYWKVATTNKEVATERKSCNHKKVIKKKLLDSVDSNNDITEKQRLFCIFYAISNNATQSYLKAYQCNADVLISSDQAKEAAAEIKGIAESGEAPSYTISTTAGQAQAAEKEAQESYRR